jgi:hypothetical protein
MMNCCGTYQGYPQQPARIDWRALACKAKVLRGELLRLAIADRKEGDIDCAVSFEVHANVYAAIAYTADNKAGTETQYKRLKRIVERGILKYNLQNGCEGFECICDIPTFAILCETYPTFDSRFCELKFC